MRTVLKFVVLAGLLGSVAACGPTVTMPDVVGMRLDAAHRELEAMGVENFEDVDVIGDRDTIFRDANWVVVEQNPAPGSKEVDTDQTIKLSVGNQDDKEVLELIPADSPFATEVAKVKEKKEREAAAGKAASEKEAREKKQETAKAAKAYAQKIDKAFGKSMVKLVGLYVSNADRVQAEGGGPVVAAQNALASKDGFERFLTVLNERDISPPGELDDVKALRGVPDELRDAVAGFIVASDSLLDAIDTGAPSAFAEELSERAKAIETWNNAVKAVYEAGGLEPLLIRAG